MIKMNEIKSIETRLKYLTHQEDIDILFAVESGSRVWGFSSEDSDYDVRFVYTYQDKKRYTDLFIEPSPQITKKWSEGLDIDLVGWELKKYLRLLHKSNCTAVEWLVSPILYNPYRKATDWRALNNARAVIMKFAYPTIDYFKVFKHYISMAKANYMKYIGRSDYESHVTAKKYLYVLRGIFASAYASMKQEVPVLDIIDLAGNTIPHIFKKLGIAQGDYALKKLESIIELKNDTEETTMIRDGWLDSFIETYFEKYEYDGEELNPSKEERIQRDKLYNKYYRMWMK